MKWLASSVEAALIRRSSELQIRRRVSGETSSASSRRAPSSRASRGGGPIERRSFSRSSSRFNQDASGVIRVVPLFQVYAILEPNKELINVRAEIDSLKADALQWAPAFHNLSRPRGSRDVDAQTGLCSPSHVQGVASQSHLFEISIYDLHLAKLAWNHETGWSDWDTDLTTAAFNAAIETLVERSRPYPIDRILFPIGHDFFQVDNPSNTTTAGTSVDVDSRFKKTYRVGRQLLCRAIERLAEIAPVDVVMVSGNHDRFSNFTLGDSLECWFKNHPSVTIDNRPTRRKYYRYGRVLLGLTHGDDIKHADLFSLMPVEAPAEFASTTWREWHLGHLHKESLAEKHGIRTRVLPSLCSADEWHSAKGFVGNMRTATSFIWHPTDCLVNQSYYHIPEARPGQAEIFNINK